MSLNDGNFTSDLTNAFNQDSWDNCADLFSAAIKNYLDSGSVTTTVSATVTPPIGPPYPVSDTGDGVVTTTPTTSLSLSIKSAFQGDDWSASATDIANAINTYIISCTATISTYQVTLVGSGTGPIVATGLASLISGIISSFNQDSWNNFITMLKTHIKTFITTCTITTTDSGVVPPSSWTGVGTGSIS